MPRAVKNVHSWLDMRWKRIARSLALRGGYQVQPQNKLLFFYIHHIYLFLICQHGKRIKATRLIIWVEHRKWARIKFVFMRRLRASSSLMRCEIAVREFCIYWDVVGGPSLSLFASVATAREITSLKRRRLCFLFGARGVTFNWILLNPSNNFMCRHRVSERNEPLEHLVRLCARL